MDKFRISYLHSGGLITNYNCTSRCRHCLYKCSPGRSNAYIDENTVRMNLKKVKSSGCSALHIGGGEPFLQFDKLLRVVEIFKEEHVHIDYIETNSSWFKDENTAITVLKQLKKKSVNTLLISISPFHNEYIPFYKVTGVISACQKAGIRIFPWVMDFYHEIEDFDIREKHSPEEYIAKYGENYIGSIPRRYWIHFGGRALETYSQIFDLQHLSSVLTYSGCTELLDTSHFHIDLYGNYIPGLCSGLAIPAGYLNKEIEPADFPVLARLLNGGTNALYEWAQEIIGFTPGEKYLNKCHLCNDIRQKLFSSNIKYNELAPAEYYES